MMICWTRQLFLLALAATLAACGDSQNDAAQDADETTLRVMTFNIEWGGTHVDFDKVIEAIRRSGADIVGIQEPEGNLERLARALGWHFNRRVGVISRYALYEPQDADRRYVFAEIGVGRVVAIANLHLPSEPYGPAMLRDGATREQVMANERVTRMPFLAPYLAALRDLQDVGIPAFVTGDFNSPTHTDWTPGMIGQRPFLDLAIAWPVSVAMHDAGLHDAWRGVYPDVRTHPGLTWWAGRPPLPDYAPGPHEPQDRIDLIWHSEGARPTAATIVGEPGADAVTVAVQPWPSDHRAVIVTFAVRPAPLPELLAAAQHVYRTGEAVRVRARLMGEQACDVSVTAEGGQVVASTMLPTCDGSLQLTAPAPGRYRVTMRRGATAQTTRFDVLAPGARAMLDVARAGLAAGERVIATWRDAPGNRNDYLAIYPGTDPLAPEAMSAWVYIDSKPHGSIDITDLVGDGTAALRVRLMKDDGYEALAEATLPPLEQSAPHGTMP